MVNGYTAHSLAEALEIRAAHSVIPYAGGTDLMVENRPNPIYLFLARVPELCGIREDETYIRIGAAVTYTQALESPLVPPLMKAAVAQIAAPAIRNVGTFGGNLGNGSAKADSVLIEFVTDAKLRIASVRGERLVNVADFYQGRKQLDLASDELIVEILLPKPAPGERWHYEKVGGRNALAISRVSFAGVYEERDGRIVRLAAGFGAVAATVLRYPDLEAMLVGKTVEEAKSLKPDFLTAYEGRMQLTRGRVSAEYRKAVCLRLLGAFLEEMGI